MSRTSLLFKFMPTFLLLVVVGCAAVHKDDGFVATLKGDSHVVPTGTIAYLAPLSQVSASLSRDGLVPANVTHLRFRGLDNGGIPVFGPVTLAKAAALTLEDVPVTTDRLVVELLVPQGILAATSVPVRVAQARVTTVKNPYFFSMAPGGKPAQAEGAQDYGYVYHLATLAGIRIDAGSDIPLSNNGSLKGVDHRPGTGEVTVASDGFYLIDYRASLKAEIGASLAIAINGQVDASTTALLIDSFGLIEGQAVLCLKAGDVVTLRNSSRSAITLALGPKVAARLGILRLGF